MISQKTKYAIKALVLLANEEKARKGPVLISELARRGRMPRKFLEAILLELKNTGYLNSKKGKGGGYELAKPAREIFLGSVIRVFEGPLALIPCVSPSIRHRCRDCEDPDSAGIRAVFKEVRDTTAEILDNTSLERVLRVQEEERKNKVPTYAI